MAIHTKVFTKPSNDIVAAAIDRFPDRFLGWVTVNPMIPVSVEEVELYLNKPSFIGVKELICSCINIVLRNLIQLRVCVNPKAYL